MKEKEGMCIIYIYIYILICLSLGASNSVSVLRREVAKLKMLLKDRENDIKNKEGQIAALKESLCKAQEKHEEKTKASFNDFYNLHVHVHMILHPH